MSEHIRERKELWMNIAFDIDGVLTDFEWFLNIYGRKYFSKYKNKSDIIIASSSVSERFGYSKKWEKKFYTRYLFWYATQYPIRENAAEVIHTLRQQGNKIYLITARALADKENVLGMLMRRCLLKWLKKNRVEYDGIYFVSTNNSAEEKCKLCKALKISIMVEDEPVNIIKIRGICKVICMSADYNQAINSHARAIDFGEVYWNIIQGQKSFSPLDYKVREELGNVEKVKYFDDLKNYYVTMPFDMAYLKQCQNNLQRVLKIFKGVFRMLIPYQIIEGKIPISCQGVIFVCNHKSMMDVPICYYILNNIQVRVLTKRELEAMPIGGFMRSIGIIFVNRKDKKSGKATQNLMIQTLLNDGNILLFPEGTRNRTSKTLLDFKMGAVYMAQVTGAPIIPIAMYKEKRIYKIAIGSEINVDALDSLEEKNHCLKETVQAMLKKLIE